jgi:hypothetical protein
MSHCNRVDRQSRRGQSKARFGTRDRRSRRNKISPPKQEPTVSEEELAGQRYRIAQALRVYVCYRAATGSWPTDVAELQTWMVENKHMIPMDEREKIVPLSGEEIQAILCWP